jgi:5-methylcytosine-specific restriction endonuclease McrA
MTKIYKTRACKKCGNVHSDAQCKVCLAASFAAWRAKNLEREKARRAAYYAANKERENQSSREYSQANKERIRAAHAKWAVENADKRAIYEANRRARKKGRGRLSPDIAERLFALQRGKCACCGEPLGDEFQIDHIMPIALGGENIDANVQLLRARCNRQKHAKHPVEYMQSRGFLL